jgi:hypothetical protein
MEAEIPVRRSLSMTGSYSGTYKKNSGNQMFGFCLFCLFYQNSAFGAEIVNKMECNFATKRQDTTHYHLLFKVDQFKMFFGFTNQKERQKPYMHELTTQNSELLFAP